MTAELADGWLPIMFVPEKARDVWGDSLDAGAAKRAAELGRCRSAPAAWSRSARHETKGLLDFLRPMYALYVGGMGARGKNFYNELACQYGYEKEAKEIQDLYLDGKKKEAEALVPHGVDRGEQPGRPRVVRQGADRRLRRGRRHPPLDRPGRSTTRSATVSQVKDWVS